MADRKPRAAIRGASFARPVRWLLLALAGTAAGLMLGEHVAGSRLGSSNVGTRDGGGYAGFSANPDALTADAARVPPCTDCADSYGAAARLRARRAERVNADLPDPDADTSGETAAESDDDYHYGGRFPDPEPARPAPPEPENTMPDEVMPPPD